MKRLSDSLPTLPTRPQPTDTPTRTGTRPCVIASIGLTAQQVAEMDEDALIQTLLPFTGPLQELSRDRVSDDGQFDTELIGYRIRPDAEISLVQEIVAAANLPASPKQIGKELAKIRAAGLSNRHGNDLEAWTAVMLEDLAEFPAAVVLEALRRWRRREKFLPTVAEIREDCHWIGRKRRALQRLEVA